MVPRRLFVYSLIARLLPETRFFALKRLFLLFCGVKLGKDVKVCSSARFLGNGSIEIGDNTWIGPDCLFISSSESKILIGQDCDIAPRVTITTGTHMIDKEGTRAAGKAIGKDVIVERGCWLGMSAVILPGIWIAKKTIIGAGTVVSRDIHTSGVIVGAKNRYL